MVKRFGMRLRQALPMVTSGAAATVRTTATISLPPDTDPPIATTRPLPSVHCPAFWPRCSWYRIRREHHRRERHSCERMQDLTRMSAKNGARDDAGRLVGGAIEKPVRAMGAASLPELDS